MPSSFTAFLARSLVLFEDELPVVYREIARRVGDREVSCAVDAERITIRSDGLRLRLTRDVAAPVVFLRTSRDVIADLLHARTTLAEAVWADRILLRGDLSDLIHFHDGLMAYLAGAVRCPSFPELLDEYLDRFPDRAADGVRADDSIETSPEHLRGAA
ncbi:MAG TPA: hypothetical protein VHE30_25180 [Polyangiaceae bacterium]|nr:hypothetical protein [Polyangiaceae bacterium]